MSSSRFGNAEHVRVFEFDVEARAAAAAGSTAARDPPFVPPRPVTELAGTHATSSAAATTQQQQQSQGRPLLSRDRFDAEYLDPEVFADQADDMHHLTGTRWQLFCAFIKKAFNTIF